MVKVLHVSVELGWCFAFKAADEVGGGEWRGGGGRGGSGSGSGGSSGLFDAGI